MWRRTGQSILLYVIVIAAELIYVTYQCDELSLWDSVDGILICDL